MVKNPDSVDKIITIYLAATCNEPFEYKGKKYIPHTLTLSPLIFREFICPPGCGGCCPLFSLDFLPFEIRTCLSIIMKWVSTGPHNQSLIIPNDWRKYV